MATLLSFHGDKKVKAKYLARVEAHRKADELVQGVGWEQNGVTRGCAVGCIFDGYDHTRGPVEIGVPEWLLRLVDTLHENMPRASAIGKGPKTCWPRRFLDAIPVGVDLEPVRWKFSLLLLDEHAERVHGLELAASLKSQVLIAIAKVREVNAAAIVTGKCDESAAWLAESARSAELAWSAVSAARSAVSAARDRNVSRSAVLARLAAVSAAELARSAELAWLAVSAARSARLAVSKPAMAAEAESAAYVRYADKLIELLRDA